LIVGFVVLFIRFLNFLQTFIRQPEYPSFHDDYDPGDFELFPFPGGEDIGQEPYEVNPVVMWLVLGFFLLVLSGLIIFAFVKLIMFAFKLLKAKHQRAIVNSNVFTETIEKIESSRKKRSKKSRAKRLTYSSLMTESERIKYIYYEYVRRAKRNGLTSDTISDTPNVILDEVVRNIQDSSEKKDKDFPLPGNLGGAFCKVRYGDCNDNADEIKACDFLHLK
jgi:hypothetical protein